jgi:DNA polymerase
MPPRSATPDRSAADCLPRRLELPALVQAAGRCQGCDLYLHATQTVFGEGPPSARLVLVGETPGDQEDRAGHPFVGPAGRLLDSALEETGIDRQQVYVTNVVKHFKWTPRGKRRLHSKPTSREIGACRPWLEAELRLIRPEMIVCLGATAAQAMLGKEFRITKQRGQVLACQWSGRTLATYHPSALLRAPDREQRAQMYREFVEDLRTASQGMHQ